MVAVATAGAVPTISVPMLAAAVVAGYRVKLPAARPRTLPVAPKLRNSSVANLNNPIILTVALAVVAPAITKVCGGSGVEISIEV